MPTLELNGKPFAEQTGTGEPVLKGNINFEGPIRINNQEVLSANGSIGSAVDFTNIANNAISGDKIYGGTISTSAAVFEGSSANAIVRITQTGAGNALVVEDSANPDSTPFVVNASGNVGIGAGSPQDGLDVAKNARIGQGQISADSTVGVLGIYGGLAGSTTNSQLRFFGKSVSNTGLTYEIARISGSSFGPYSLDGGIQFSTASNDGANNLTLTERMRIDSSGNVGLTGGGTLSFYFESSVVGSIVPSSTGTTYNTTSDLRLKDNIQPISDGTEKLMAMNPVSHTWKADPEAHSVHGFIAQEMVNIIPEAVSGTPDGEEMMTMDYGRITPVLVAALQDAHKKIKELENRLNTLESN